jgi:hypothetical protein
MAKKKTNEKGVEGEDYIVLTPERNSTTIFPWGLRMINNTGRSIHIDFRHTNLMTKVLYISDEKEASAESAERKKKIAERIGKEL